MLRTQNVENFLKKAPEKAVLEIVAERREDRWVFHVILMREPEDSIGPADESREIVQDAYGYELEGALAILEQVMEEKVGNRERC